MKNKIDGEIRYFGLDDWWLTEFTNTEQEYIVNKYDPMGSRDSSLIEGNISFISVSSINFLGSLASWFSKTEDRYIAYKIIKKAEELITPSTNVIDLHFLYSTKLELMYKDRDSNPNGLELAIQACQQQIACAPSAAIEFRRQWGEKLPRHIGYQQLAIIREKQKDFNGVITLCREAINQGWDGDWEKRIERCAKKLAKIKTSR